MINKDKLLKKIEEQEKLLASLKEELKNINSAENINTLSYKLGYILIHDTRSIKGILSLPKKLYELRKYSLQRIKNSPAKIDNVIEFSKKEKVNIEKPNIEKTNAKNSIDTQFNKGLTLLDPISELCWKDAFIGYPIDRKKFKQQIETSTSQFAFFESAWRANNSTWLYAFTSPGLKHANAQALLETIDLLKKRNIPILFWNKEDPMHYEMFKPIAKYADYIFTTDALVIDKYKKELNIEHVYALPFAAPVKKTNPLHRFLLKSESVCFAGTYYAKNHENRKKQMDMLLPSLLENNGCIYDRASNEKKEDYAYPSQYSHILRPSVDFKEMVTLYKKFKVFLNVNTITQSTTMMSRRVYELLASGTPVVSTPSKAITEQFPGIVITVNNEQEAKLAVKELLSNSYYWHKQSMLGIREVLHKHTYEHRWNQIQSILQNKHLTIKNPSVRIIAIYHGYIDLELFLQSLINQSNVDVSEVLLVKSDTLKINEDIILKYNINLLSLKDFNVKKHINISEDIKYTFITNDKVYNYKYSIWGMLLAFNYSDSPAVIRSPYYKYSNIKSNFDFSIENPNWYEFMREVSLSCLLIQDKDIEKISIDIHNKKAKSTGDNKNILMIDPFNLITLDHSDIISSKKQLQDFIYKTSPYLGI